MADKKSILATYLEFLDDLNKQLKKIPSLDPEKYNCPFPVSQTTFKEVTTAIIKIEIEPSYNLLKKEIRILNIFLQQLIINGYRPPKKEISKAIEKIEETIEEWKKILTTQKKLFWDLVAPLLDLNTILDSCFKEKI